MTNKTKIIVNTLVIAVVVLLIGGATFALKNHKNSNQAQTVKTDTWADLEADGTITIGLDDTYVPMGFRDTKGNLVGFDVDLANATFKKLGLKVKWQPIDWSMKETELNTGNIDAIWNGYTISPEREKKVAFSQSYLDGYQELVVKSNSGITAFAGMKNKVLGLQTASTAEDLFNAQPKLLKNIVKDQTSVGYDTFDKAFDDLNAGRIDGLLIDNTYANYYIAHQKNPSAYRVIKGDVPVDKTGVGFRKSDVTLRKKVDATLTEFKKDGTLAKIEQKWFGDN